MNTLASERELKVLRMRNGGATYKEIGLELGVSMARAEALYLSGLERLRIERWMRKNAVELLTTADKFGFDGFRLTRIYNIMKKHGILYSWKHMTEDELEEIPQIGDETLYFLMEAKRNWVFKNRR